MFLLLTDLDPIVEHVFDQISMRYDILFESGHLRDVLGFGCLYVEERYEDADLEHVHKLFVEGLAHDLAER